MKAVYQMKITSESLEALYTITANDSCEAFTLAVKEHKWAYNKKHTFYHFEKIEVVKCTPII